MSGLRTAAVLIGIEADINDALIQPAKLSKLPFVEMRTQRRNGIFEARLPQCGHIEQPFDHDDAGKSQRL